MPKRALGHPELPDPPKFSRAVEVTGGRTIYFAGQAPIDASGNTVGTTLGEQAARCLEKMAGILEANGGSMDDIVHLVFYVTDISNFFGEVQPARDEHFSGPVYPAMSGVQVAALADPSLVEVDGTAVID